MLKKIAIVFSFIGMVCIFEPACKDSLIFAVTYLDNPKVNYERIDSHYTVESLKSVPAQQKTHAPEPATLLLFLGGIGGVIVRFARKRFTELKRGIDILLSVAGLLLIGPFLFLSAIFIKLTSPGAVIYCQDRLGRNGRVFKIYKLRTMRSDAENHTGAVWAKENDPRITAVGSFLRKTHFDEVPQLLNVIKGQMSIVGPRPERPELVRDLKEVVIDYEKRLLVKPGITGLAQVWHKYDETIADVKKKIKYDLLYIRKMCLLVDLRILAQTCLVVVTGRGAR